MALDLFPPRKLGIASNPWSGRRMAAQGRRGASSIYSSEIFDLW